jgi:hypothetical protein
MNKLLIGLLAGAVLGLIDGGTAWFTPAVRSQIVTILLGSCFKGLLVGIVAGAFARKVNSVPLGVLLGCVLGLLLAWGVAAMGDEQGNHYYLEIMLPGFITGGIIGFLTQRYGGTPAPLGQR